MLNKNFLLGCVIAALTACGGQGSLDLGPTNSQYGATPSPTPEPPTTEKTWTWNFEDDSQLASWVTWTEAAQNSGDCNLETSLSLHWQSSALQIAPAEGWQADFEQLCAFGYVDEPVDMAGGSFYMSVYLPSFFTDQNPWNTDADDGPEDDRFNFGIQVIIEDVEGNRGEAAGWVNVYELLGSSFNAEGFGRQQRKDDPVAGDVAGRWFDMRFNAENASGDANISEIVAIGLMITIRDTNLNLSGDDVFGNGKYVFIDNVLLEPNPDYIPPAPSQDPAFLSLPIYTEGEIQAGFGELTGTGGEYTLRESMEAAFAGGYGSVQIAGPDPAMDVSGYTVFRFSVYGPEDSGTTSLDVSLCDCESASVSVDVEGRQWNDYAIEVTEFSDISFGAIKFEYNGIEPLTYYFDNIGFVNISPPDFNAGGLHPVTNKGLVFFDFNLDEEDTDGLDKRSWWGQVVPENDELISLDGTSYGRVNFQTGDTAWKDLFWRNGGSMYGQNIVADNIGDYVLKFDINVITPIEAGTIKIRFHDNDGIDAFYDWAPWTESGEPYSTDGWETVVIPLSELGVPDFSLVDNEFGMAFEGADVMLDFAIDNVRFDYPGNQALSEVKDEDLVFYDFNLDGEDADGLDKGSWWGQVVSENDDAISLDGTGYGRLNFQTGDTAWKDLFWRNGSSLYGQNEVADNLDDFVLKFDINVLSPIDAGQIRIRFHDDDGVDAFYDWAPWGTDNPYATDGWVTVTIPGGDLGVPDMSLVDNEFGMAFEGADILLNVAVDNVRFERIRGAEPVDDPSLVFFDFNLDEEDEDGLDKRSWWGQATPENDPFISLDGTSYGRINFQTGDTAWKDLFWRNGGSLYGQDVVAANLADYVLKFDINVLTPIEAGTFKIRFHDDDGVDAFFDWAPWTDSGAPYSTDGWTTVSIPLVDLGVPDFSLVDNEFGMAFEGADVTLNFAMDNMRFEYIGD